MCQAKCYMPTHSHQRTNHQRDTYSQICLGHRSVNVTQQAYSCLAPCNKPGRCRADLLVSLLRSSFLYLYSVFAIEIQFDPAVSGWCRLVGCTWIRNQTRSATLDQERVSACRWTSGDCPQIIPEIGPQHTLETISDTAAVVRDRGVRCAGQGTA